ncbi:tail assembly chaperone [Bacillus phage SP-10]|uniref:tail assembly chaperone n=1 Tax=Bacillus phage SP10 TaxID=941058 RepID=UPI0002198B6A|nr:tail assembly chaperone [Bacillus phage SP-10]BAK52962.1 tail assembly chaperone [Bacillus phage SP-10]
MDQNRLIGKGILAGTGRQLTKDLDFTEFDPKYTGRFIFKHPTVLDQMNIDVLKTQMLQGFETPSIIADNIAHMSSTLTVVLVEAPEWFKINEIYDYEILDRVYEEYLQWYRTFRRKDRQGNTQGDSKTS